MKILHIIRNPDEATGLDFALEQSKEHEVSILFMHDGVYSVRKKMDFPATVFFCKDDLQARGLDTRDALDYDQIVDVIFSHDKVICW